MTPHRQRHHRQHHPSQGDTLTAGNTLADADGLGTITYTWKADGVVVGSGATYVLTEAEVGKTGDDGRSELYRRARHGRSREFGATAAVANVNDAPPAASPSTPPPPARATAHCAATPWLTRTAWAPSPTRKADGVVVGSRRGNHVLTEADVGKVMTSSKRRLHRRPRHGR